MKPKRKPKNKNFSIDEQITLLLDDDEYIIWSAPTHHHYFSYSQLASRKTIRGLVAFYAVLLGMSLVLSPNIFSIVAGSILSLGILSFIGISVYTHSNSQHYLSYVNGITNYQVFVYDMRIEEIVHAFDHDNIHQFRVREYGDNIGNITVDRRSDQKAKYRATPTFPLEFTLRGIDDLSTVVQLLRSQLGIEPDYLQIHDKRKTQS